MFAGHDTEDPYGHVKYFEDVCANFNLNIFTEDEVKFKLFGQTLTEKVRAWYDDYPTSKSSQWRALSTKLDDTPHVVAGPYRKNIVGE
jgi:hypothetical protein